MFGKGISKAGGILDMGVEMEIIRKSGAFFSYNDLRLGQGRENARTFLQDNPHVMEEIESRIRGGGTVPAVLTMTAAERLAAEREAAEEVEV